MKIRSAILMLADVFSPLLICLPFHKIKAVGRRYRVRAAAGEKGRMVLVSDTSIPEHDRSAGSRVSRQYLELMVRMGYIVFFLPRDCKIREPYCTQLSSLGIRIVIPFGIGKWIERNAKAFDYFYLQSPDSSFIMDLILKKKREDSAIIYFPKDLHHVRLRRQYEVEADPRLLEAAAKAEAAEKSIFAAADVIHVVGSYEEGILKAEYAGKRVTNIPLFLFDGDGSTEDYEAFSRREGMLFVGSYRHAPNMDALLWFLGDIWEPAGLWKKSISFTVVGSGYPAGILSEWAAMNVVVRRDLPDDDLVRAYRDSRLTVVPLRYGAGVKGKILEAMFHGLPVLSTPIGVEGIDSPDGCAAVAKSHEEWLAMMPRLYEDEGRLFKMAGAARRFILREYSTAKAAEALAADMPIGDGRIA